MAGKKLEEHSVAAVGAVAGQIWKYLDKNGDVTLSKLSREIDLPRDLVMQGVGWLAREDKVLYRSGARYKTITLKE